MSQRTFGPFQVLTPLASGGMARADLVRLKDAAPGNEFVLKTVKSELAANAELQALFRAEAAVAQQLEHENIVRAIGTGDVDGKPYLALDYVWGDDLRHIARQANKSRHPLPRVLVARIIRDAARGLHHAHALTNDDGQPLNLVHRDVSPPNIMVRFDGSVVLIDFGIARLERKFQRARAGQLKGKFAYMSPEQVRGLPVDRRSDVFSLGVVLYEFSVGRRLFRGSSDMATAAAIVAAKVPPPTDIDPQFPDALDAIIRRALAADPDDRFATAEAFAVTLDAWLDTQSGGTQEDLATWMQHAFADRIAELETVVGVPSYRGPAPLAALPLSHTDNLPVTLEKNAMTSPEPSDTPPAPPTPDTDDVFMEGKKTSRAIYGVIGVALIAVLALMGIQVAKNGAGMDIDTEFEAPRTSSPDFDYEPPPAPPTTTIQVGSTPAGAAIIVNGWATGDVTPAQATVVEGQPNVISLHLDGHATTFVETTPGEDVSATLAPLPEPEATPVPTEDPTAEPEAEGSADVDPGPGPGNGRIRVEVTTTDGQAAEAEVRVNGQVVGNAPVRVDVAAGQRHHVTARLAGMRDSAAYVRPIEWVDRNSESVVSLELTADVEDGNRWTTLRRRASPQIATVTVNGEDSASQGLTNLDVPGHHVVRVQAPDHVPLVRAVDTRLGQMTIDAVLDVVRTDPAQVSITSTQENTTVYIERLRQGSAGARELQQPIEALEVESGTHRITLEHRGEDRRTRGRFEVELMPGMHHTFTFALDGESFAQTEATQVPVEE